MSDSNEFTCTQDDAESNQNEMSHNEENRSGLYGCVMNVGPINDIQNGSTEEKHEVKQIVETENSPHDVFLKCIEDIKLDSCNFRDRSSKEKDVIVKEEQTDQSLCATGRSDSDNIVDDIISKWNCQLERPLITQNIRHSTHSETLGMVGSNSVHINVPFDSDTSLNIKNMKSIRRRSFEDCSGISSQEVGELVKYKSIDEHLIKIGSEAAEMRFESGVDLENLSICSSRVKDNSEPVFPKDQIYQLKWIYWLGRRTPIVTQNENGPCPLIAIANVLLLKGAIHLPKDANLISGNQLLNYVADQIMESVPKNLPRTTELNLEQNLHDAMQVLPSLQTGLDVNIKFTGVNHFEYTPECIIFDMLNIPLYHGWLVDPQNEEDIVWAIGNSGYNQLVDRILVNKMSNDTDLVTQAFVAEQFLERTATQLTYHGLCELNGAMQNQEPAVLFRNNHFSTIVKIKNNLYQLVTDQGFLNEPKHVWETLSSVDGDGQFVDSSFFIVRSETDGLPPEQKNVVPQQQIQNDIQDEFQNPVNLSLAHQPSLLPPHQVGNTSSKSICIIL